MSIENLVVLLCISVIAIPVTVYVKEYMLTCGAIVVMFLTALAIAYRLLGGA